MVKLEMNSMMKMRQWQHITTFKLLCLSYNFYKIGREYALPAMNSTSPPDNKNIKTVIRLTGT